VKRHRNLSSLDKPTRQRIKRLAALLRIADGLDRGHVGAVASIRARWGARGIRLTVVPAQSAASVRLEAWAASRKLDLLERVTGVPVILVDQDGRQIGGTEVPPDAPALVRAAAG
jgi:exopolyphosphatase/guanosine-5'-triphosphate,3'-diphosphate pyrophosphatase